MFINGFPLTAKATRRVDESTLPIRGKGSEKQEKGQFRKRKYLIFEGARITQRKADQSTFVSIQSSPLTNNLP